MSDGGGDRAAEAAEELYALPPAEFTRERDRLVRAAREAGERDLAAAIGELRRPTLAAWAVNLLVRKEAALVQQVLDVGEALREAQESLQGDALRDLGRQRRELVAAVVARASDLVADQGADLSDSAQQQVSASLNAALADPHTAHVVTSGLLVKPVESGGLPALELGEHVAGETLRSRASSAPPRRSTQTGSQAESVTPDRSQAELQRLSAERRRLRQEEAEQRVADAEQAAQEARAAADEAGDRLEKAKSRVLQVEARIDEVRRSLADLESEAESAVDRAEELEQETDEAHEAVAEADRELTEAQSALSDLD